MKPQCVFEHVIDLGGGDGLASRLPSHFDTRIHAFVFRRRQRQTTRGCFHTPLSDPVKFATRLA